MDDTKPSKSARKREHLARQKLGEELITLKDADLRSLALDEDLFEAVVEAHGIKSHGALRRQKQYIGKIMRHIDPEPVRTALENLRRK